MSWSFSRWLGVHVVEDFQMAGCARDLVRVHVGAGGWVQVSVYACLIILEVCDATDQKLDALYDLS